MKHLKNKNVSEMTEQEYNTYGEYLQRMQRLACGAKSYGQGSYPSVTALKKAHFASKELMRIKFGFGYEKAKQAEQKVDNENS